ncbi:hypothetical protein BDZ89DRAFT_30746 [Hymenopellis radicata]|nr:hypothetical protein BDZ89DRAFT_30746 [Hymenopellis radicata]
MHKGRVTPLPPPPLHRRQLLAWNSATRTRDRAFSCCSATTDVVTHAPRDTHRPRWNMGGKIVLWYYALLLRCYVGWVVALYTE